MPSGERVEATRADATGHSYTATAVVTRICCWEMRVTLQETIWPSEANAPPLYTPGQHLALPCANISHKKERQE